MTERDACPEWLPSRRRFLGGTAGVVGLIGGGAYLARQSSSEPTFLLRQGYLRWAVDPISKPETNVEEFYNVQGTSADPAATIIEEDAASRLFVYDGPVDASLVFLHGSREVDHGGTAEFSFSGFSRDQGEWVVRDDPRSVSDDFAPWDGGDARVKWQWGRNTTDGGAYWGVLDREEFTISISPKTFSGVDSWKFLSGEIGDLERYELSQERPVQLKPARGRTVMRANVEIMPEAERNEFDPYSEDRITVAVRSPPEAADGSEWVAPDDLDPGNYSVNFGSKSSLAGENAAQPQDYYRQDGDLFLEYTTRAAQFTLESAYGYVVGKTDEKTFVRGWDIVYPGGFDNVDADPAQLVVSDRHVDPGSQDLRDEYVEFANAGDRNLDIGGWQVQNGAGTTYVFPAEFTLAGGETVRLHTGSGESTGSDRYWGREESAWGANSGTITVLDAGGSPVLTFEYPQA